MNQENERRPDQERVSDSLEGRQDFRHGTEVPENLYGKDRARAYNTAGRGEEVLNADLGGDGNDVNTGREGPEGQERPVVNANGKQYVIPRTEDEMKRDVAAALESEPNLDSRDIQIEVHDGIIILRGRVSHARMRSIAEDCLDQFSEVHVIRNEIEVRAGSRGFPSIGNSAGPVIPGDLSIDAQLGAAEQEEEVPNGDDRPLRNRNQRSA